MVVIFAILALILGFVMADVIHIIDRTKYDQDVAQFAQTLQYAAEQAAVRGTEMALALEIYEGHYTIWQANPKDEYDPEVDEPVISRRTLRESYLEEITYEDGSHQYSGDLIFRCTPRGWPSSVVFTIIDLDKRYHYVLLERFTNRVTVSPRPLEIPEPRTELSIDVPI